MKGKIISNLTLFLSITILVSSCHNGHDWNEPVNVKSDELEALIKFSAPTGTLDYFILPASDDLQNIPQDPNNPLTADKIELGKLLFHETGFGTIGKHEQNRGTYSCASCHHAGAGFQAGTAQGIGDGGMGFGHNGEARLIDPLYDPSELDVQPIRTPTALNVAYQENMLWNGQFGATGVNINTEAQWTEGTPKAVNKLGYSGVETQAIAGLEVHRMDINEMLVTDLGYKSMFDAVFANFPQDERYTRETAGLAIAAYERTLLANLSPFQKWLKYKEGLSDQALDGALLFFGKAECVSCHTGPALNKLIFCGLGMNDLNVHDQAVIQDMTNFDDKGRGGFTGNPNDNYKFKVPQLYNLKDMAVFGHGSSFTNVYDVIKYKNEAIPQNPEVDVAAIDPLFVPLHLTDQEIEALTEFLEVGLYDDNLNRYVPQNLPSGNCFPNADDQSRIDLGCE